MDTLGVGTGLSWSADSREAGREAATTAVASLDGGEPSLVLLLTTPEHDLDALLAGVRSVTGHAPLAGATTSGALVDGVFVPPGTGAAVLALAGGPYRFGVASAVGMGTDPARVGTELATAAREAAGGPQEHAALLLLADGLAGDSAALVRGVHRATGAAVPLVGGAAGDDRRMSRTSVLHGDRVLGDAAVGVWITSPHPLGVHLRHGWSAVSPTELVTSAGGLQVREIAGRPAAHFLEQHSGPPSEDGSATVHRADGSIWEASYALGVVEPDGTHAVRGCYANPDGSLTTFAVVEEYSAVQVVTADAEAVLGTVAPVARAAVASVPDARVLLAFDCIARADILGGAVADEAAALRVAAGDAVSFGFYTYGEYARDRSLNGVHNASLGALAL